jgi:hypothetical protein
MSPNEPARDAGLRALVVEVLIQHQRKDIGSCMCGWGVDSGQVGRSHSAHVAGTVMPVIAAYLRGVASREEGGDDHIGMLRAAEIIESER